MTNIISILKNYLEIFLIMLRVMNIYALIGHAKIILLMLFYFDYIIPRKDVPKKTPSLK